LKPNIANTYIKLKDPDQARRYLEETQALADIPQGSADDYMIRQTYGHLAHLEGDLEKADRLLNEALSFYRGLSIYTCIMEQNAVYEDLYEVYQERGRWAKGEDLLLEAIDYTQKNEFWLLHIHYLGLLAKHFEESHEATKAYDTLRRFYKSQMKFDEIRRARKIRNIELRIEMDQLKKEKSELHSIARLDRLTGIYNRRAMQEHFDQFLRGELATEGQNFAGLLLDVDYFKEYNDLYGHLAGDQALKKIAGVLEELADSFGGKAHRYGGDEFLMVFESITDAQASELANRLIQGVQDLQILHGVSYVSEWVTVSAGIYVTDRAHLVSFDQAFTQMDEVLYLAKRKGRNRVETRSIH
jgi:diguanylate cyclase (GGDEF)-like protein